MVDTGKHTTGKKLYNKSYSLCEDTLGILQEILYYDSGLHVRFDRNISFDIDGDLSADIVSLPRLFTSRSNEKMSDDCRLADNQSVKLAVVERLMHNIGRDATPETKTVTRTVAVPKNKIVKQQLLQQTTPNDSERTDFTPIRPQPPLPNQKDGRDKR